MQFSDDDHVRVQTVFVFAFVAQRLDDRIAVLLASKRALTDHYGRHSIDRCSLPLNGNNHELRLRDSTQFYHNRALVHHMVIGNSAGVGQSTEFRRRVLEPGPRNGANKRAVSFRRAVQCGLDATRYTNLAPLRPRVVVFTEMTLVAEPRDGSGTACQQHDETY